MRRVTAAVLLATLLLAAGCGGGDDDDATPAAKSTATAAGGKLDEDALLAVHDNLVTCAQQHDLGLVAHLSGDQAISDTEGSGGGEYDDHLAAPKATVALTGAGAQFVGLRADTRHKTGASDVDVLIFPSEDEAATGREQLAQEAGGKAEQAGVFVNVTLRGAGGADAGVLASCEDEASRR